MPRSAMRSVSLVKAAWTVSGVTEAVGQPFNAELHEAVERVDGKENKVDMVVAETRKGYVFKDRVLRPSMVKVESAVKSDSEIE